MGWFEEQMVVHMTGRWQTGAGIEHDTVIQHNTVLAVTAHPAFVPPRLLEERTGQEVPSDPH